ncbi:MAG: zinc ribbon domain-containing protein [Nitrospirae bacterium]|nr:MAG: zinc ribbon domain-containing protein [Nitrospirota bacterium]
MPVYEYICNSCGAEFEKLVFGSQKVNCPNCNSDDLKKKFSVFGMSGVEKPFAGSSSGCSSCGSSGSSKCSSCG